MQTTLERMLKLSVQLNGLLIPAAAVESTLARHTEPLIVWNHDDVYSCSLMGSGVAIRYRNRYLLLCTRHQLKNVLDGRPSDNVGLLDKDGVQELIKSEVNAGSVYNQRPFYERWVIYGSFNGGFCIHRVSRFTWKLAPCCTLTIKDVFPP